MTFTKKTANNTNEDRKYFMGSDPEKTTGELISIQEVCDYLEFLNKPENFHFLSL